MVLVKAPGADNVKIENQTGIHTDWRGYAILPFATEGSTDNTGYYKNEGTAENIQIELRDDQDAALKNGDSKTVIVDEITRNAQFPLKARAITVNGNASQGTIEALINVIYTWQ